MQSIVDKELGVINIVRNVRARNVIARNKAGFIQMTVPSYFSDSQIYDVLEKMRSRLLKIPAKPKLEFTTESNFSTATFSVKIESRNVRNYHAKLHEGVLSITCPDTNDLLAEKVQSTIRNCIEQTMRHEANRVFPIMLKNIAEKYNFEYTSLKINKSRSRWGSCSSKKAINLSYFCLLLPQYLIEFVMLHELCHTIEMNHGQHFWKLLDSVTENKARELTHELKVKATNW